MAKEKDENAMINSFFEELDKLETGQRVLFKRGAGLALHEVGADTLTAFYRILPKEVQQWQEDDYFLAACIHCLWTSDTTGRQPFEKAIASYASTTEASDSIRKRFINLLDTAYAGDGYLASKLVRIAKMLRQKGYAVDGRTLIEDLHSWNSDFRSVQKKWTRAFSRPAAES